MNRGPVPSPEPQPPQPLRGYLEGLTSVVLLLVLVGLAWVMAAAVWPEKAAIATSEVGVVIILGLLTLALILVSLVALLHTHS
jgi:hypothetical protein